MQITRYDLQELMDEVTPADYDHCIREGYSGQAMHEGTCLGLVFEDDSRWEEFIIELTVYVSEADTEHDNQYDLNDVRKVVRRARKDNMGQGIIVYWPHGGLTLAEESTGD